MAKRNISPSGVESAVTAGSSVVGVIGTDDTGRRWSIGELARASGLTVPTLRHYDETGLLPAGERTGSGHRRYTEPDLRRLYRIRALRGLGLSLEEISGVLADSVDDLATMRNLLATQLRELERHAGRIQQVTTQIHGLLEQLDGASVPGPDQFMATLEMMTMYETYFTQEQRDRLAERRAELGEDAVDAAKTQWSGMVEELLRHVRDSTPVDDPRVQTLVGRWDELAGRFNGGDERVKGAAKAMWDDNRAELSQPLPWPADQLSALVAYLDRARQSG